MLQIHHANGTARVLQVAVADRITDVTQHILKLREVVSLRHVVWIVIPETNPKFIIGILPIRVRYAHRRFVLSSHIIPHIGVFVADGTRDTSCSTRPETAATRDTQPTAARGNLRVARGVSLVSFSRAERVDRGESVAPRDAKRP